MGRKLSEEEKKQISKDLGFSVEALAKLIEGQVPAIEETVKGKVQQAKDYLKNLISPEFEEVKKLKAKAAERNRSQDEFLL